MTYLPLFLPSGTWDSILSTRFLVISIVKNTKRNDGRKRVLLSFLHKYSTFSPESISRISFHVINLIMVSDSVLFVFHSSRREIRERCNQGTVEVTARCETGRAMKWNVRQRGNTKSGHTVVQAVEMWLQHVANAALRSRIDFTI